MTKILKSIVPVLPGLVLALALLGVAGALTATHTITAVYSFGVVNAVIMAVGVTGGLVIASTMPNSTTVAHLIVALAALAVVAWLAALGLYSTSQVEYTISAFLGGGGAMAVAGVSAAVSTPGPVPPGPESIGPPVVPPPA